VAKKAHVEVSSSGCSSDRSPCAHQPSVRVVSPLSPVSETAKEGSAPFAGGVLSGRNVPFTLWVVCTAAFPRDPLRI
jgi:hypothetical protein